MSHAPDEMDRETAAHDLDGRGGSFALRDEPHLEWTDATGAHATALERAVVVGSATRAGLVVADPTVSRLHAEFEPKDDGVWVRDLGSRNGTFVQGVRIGSALVPDGARVRLGRTTIIVTYARRAMPVELWPSDHFGRMVGSSATMRELFARLNRIAGTDSPLLILGESGTGKELVAQAVHEASPRRGQPFVIVDCAALPENLLESELFGHVKGAFTGAAAARAGAFESADGGTVFLDEIGELPLAMQPKLLRMLESRAVRRVGESSYRAVDVRFVAATHRDLTRMVSAGAFREDLYFRIAVLPVRVPPLRARPEDIAPLVRHFAAATAGVAPPSESLLRRLEEMHWLGNVRELRNFVARAAALGFDEALAMTADPSARASSPPPPPSASTGPRPRVSTLPDAVASPAAAPPVRRELPDVTLDESLRDARERYTDHAEREWVRLLLARHGRNVSAAAAAAGIDRTYLHRLIRKHGL